MNHPRPDQALPVARHARAVWLAMALIAGCGGGALLLVPLFTAGFTFTGNVGGAVHTVTLNVNPTAPTTSNGNFVAPSNITFDVVEQHDVTGSYSECTLTINVAPIAPATTIPAPFAASYSGRFVSKDAIELTPTPPTLPTLTLTRPPGIVTPGPTNC